MANFVALMIRQCVGLALVVNIFQFSGCADRNAKSVWRAIHTVVDGSAYENEDGQQAILNSATLTRDQFVRLAVPILDDELSDKGNFYEYVDNDARYSKYIASSESEAEKFHKALASSFYDRIVSISRELGGPKQAQPQKSDPPNQQALYPLT